MPGVPSRRQNLRLPVSFRGDASEYSRDGECVRERLGAPEYRRRSNDRSNNGVPAGAGKDLRQSLLAVGIANSRHVLNSLSRSGSGASFQLQQLALAFQTPAIAAEMAGCADCAMTWDDNRDWICAVGGPDGADGARATDASRD